jgi:hypothetical protein
VCWIHDSCVADECTSGLCMFHGGPLGPGSDICTDCFYAGSEECVSNLIAELLSLQSLNPVLFIKRFAELKCIQSVYLASTLVAASNVVGPLGCGENLTYCAPCNGVNGPGLCLGCLTPESGRGVCCPPCGPGDVFGPPCPCPCPL